MYKILLCEKNKSENAKISKMISEYDKNITLMKDIRTAKEITSLLTIDKIDVILCNVNMSTELGGFTFFESIMERYTKVRIVFFGELTGMGNSYAYQRMAKAIKDSEIMYLPMNFKHHDLYIALKDCFSIISKIEQQLQEREEVEELYISNKNIFRERLMIRLIKHEDDNEDELLEAMDFFNIQLEPGYTTIVIKIDDFLSMNKLSEHQKIICIMQMNKIITEDFIHKMNGYVFINNYDEVVAIIGGFNDKSALIDMCMDIKYSILDKMSIKVSVGIGYTKKNVSDIWISYREALSAVNHATYFGKNSAIHIDYIQDENPITYHYPRKKEAKLIEETIQGNKENAKQLLIEIFNSFGDSSLLPKNLISKIVMNIILELDRRSTERNEKLEGIISKVRKSASNIFLLKTVDEAYHYLNKMIIQITDDIAAYHKEKKLLLFIMITKYVSENIGYAHSVDSLAEQFNTTPKSIKHCIKENTDNLTVLEYVLQLKIKAGKMLILNSGLDIFTVSEMLGFDSINQFKTQFEKIEGISLSRYYQVKGLS